MRNLITILISLFCVQIYAPPANRQNEINVYSIYLADYKRQQYDQFRNAIAHKESRMNPAIYNDIGCIGLYQFGYSARKATGYKHIKTKAFIKNPSIWPKEDQNKAMDSLIKRNEVRLNSIISKAPYQFEGCNITKSGILAAAHLAGWFNVAKHFEDREHNPNDKNGTYLEDYLIAYSGFEF